MSREIYRLTCHISAMRVYLANQKAIIHRDLKPSNILVQEVDGRPTPKIIDFGVAKALTQRLTAETMFTRVGTLIGTPEYMSPEQASSSGEDIDTRSDVYSLGIVFYELLAGAPPLDLRGTALHEFLRRLREEEPAKPSTRVRRQDRASSTELAHKHRTEPFVLEKHLRGDLDSIALKALEKERSRRYSTSADFAADIRRYLNHEAVLAVTPSTGYRARKFARRYRVALATTAAFILVLIVTSIVSIRQSLRANRESAAAQAISNFLENDVLAQADSSVQAELGARADPDLKVRTALDRASSRIAGKFDGQPEVEARIRMTIARTYIGVGVWPEARVQSQRALELFRTALGAQNKTTLDCMNLVGFIMTNQGNYAEAQVLLNQALEQARRVLGAEDYTTLTAMTYLASIKYYTGHDQEAEALYGKVLEIERRVKGPGHPLTLITTQSLARSYMGQRKYAQAELLLSQIAEPYRRVFGRDSSRTLNVLSLLGQVYTNQRKFEQGEALLNEVIETQRRALGPEHPGTLASLTALANVYADEGRFAQAEALHLQLLEIKRRVVGPENRQTLNSLSYLVSLYQRQGKYSESYPYAAQALAGRRHTAGPDSSITMGAAADLALAYIGQDKFSAAEPLARETYDWHRKKRPDASGQFRSESLLGASLAGQKQYALAEPLLLAGYQGMAARKEQMDAADSFEIDLVGRWIRELYQTWGKPDQAAQWKNTHSAPAPK